MPSDIKIVYEDKNILVIDKPAGLVTTSEGEGRGESLEGQLKNVYIWANKLDRSGIAHRLDKGTSGLILVSKNQKWLDILKNKFKKRQIYKEYLALVGGEVSFLGEINAPIIKSRYGLFGRRQVGIDGKPSITCFELVEKYEYNGNMYSLVRIVLKTGRTHQIRAHFRYLGWPLVGDRVYGGQAKFIDRPFLHARKLMFEYKNGEQVSFESAIPPDLDKVLEIIKKGGHENRDF